MAVNTNFDSLSLANHDFSFSLYTELAKTNTGNIFYSPFSIHLLMFMSSVGAASKTFDEMMTTMHLNKSTHSLEAYKNLLEKLTSDNDKLKLASGMFIDEQFSVKNSFIENCKKYLKSSMEKLNFKRDPEKQRQYLNKWVLNKTNNKIDNVFSKDSINSNTVLVLGNAVYFNSSWSQSFGYVEEEPFYLTSTNKVNVDIMNLKHYVQYYHNDSLKFSAIELPYEFRTFKMIILLPDEKDGLKNLENNFSKIKLHEISSKMTRKHVNVKLPRFKLEQSFFLRDTLSNLGSPTMFTSAANFSNMVDSEKLYVSNIVHKTFVNVHEYGTEAAAVSFESRVYSAGSSKLVNFVADHPFIFSIVSSKNNVVLFLGRLLKL